MELAGFGNGKERAWDLDLLGTTPAAAVVDSRAGYLGGVPVAIPVPWAVDGAGVSYPAGTVLALAGSPARIFTHAITIANLTSGLLASASRDYGAAVIRGIVGRLMCITGAVPGTTGTILVREYNNYDVNSAGSPTTLQTISVDGDDGVSQYIELPNIFFPDTLVRSSRTIYYESTWIGTAPLNIIVADGPWGVDSGWIVPDSVPAGYTEFTDLGAQNRTYDVGSQPRGMSVGPASALGELGRLAEPWSRQESSLGFRITGVTRRRFGLPSTQIVYNSNPRLLEFSTDPVTPFEHRPHSHPGIFVTDDIRQMAWWPIARGMQVESAGRQHLASAFSVPTPFTTANVETGWILLAVGPGWRNIRIWCTQRTETGTTITLAELEYRVDGGTPVIIDINSLSGDSTTGDFMDVAGPINGTRMNAMLEIRLRTTTDYTAGGGREVEMSVLASASPRCDIPAPWHFPGRGCNNAAAAYKTGTLENITAIGGVRHVAVGNTTSSWTIAATITGETQSRIISFICATTGFWRIQLPAGGAWATFGELESRGQAVPAQIGRAGKRFFGYARSSTLANINGTWELEAVTPVYKVIPTAGLAIVFADLTERMFFGTIALPSAGTYVIWAKVAAQDTDGCSLRLLASLTDAFCAEPSLIDVRYETFNAANTNVTSTSTPPGSPTLNAKYLIGASPTGAWAGRAGSLASWTGNRWLFLAPEDLPVPSTATIASVFSIWNGAAWAAASGIRVISATVTVAAAATLYVRAQSCDDEAVTLSPITPVGDVTIGWEAV